MTNDTVLLGGLGVLVLGGGNLVCSAKVCR